MAFEKHPHGTFEVAVYGKGGIGKSTVSANISTALALAGKRVLQIGCDPKHDSVRLIMKGRNIPTVLDYLRDTPGSEARLEDVLHTGAHGVGCIEAGGPKPGVGCAGRGIITAFEFLEKKQAKAAFDTVVYDVLGDVVCGGFAVPVRREYADAVFLVTSGEYMAMYAANNILRGISNFDGTSHARLAGIIYNERKLPDEDARVARFAAAVGLPICAKVPRSEAFAQAEAAKSTVMDLPDHLPEQEVFTALAATVGPEMPLFPAHPLSDEELERVVLQVGITADQERQVADKAESLSVEDDSYFPCENALDQAKDALSQRAALYGCAFNGASTAAVHLTDALVIAHSPKACAFYTWQTISSPGRRNLYNRGILLPSALTPNFECTNMSSAEAVFGGMGRLRQAVQEGISRKPGAVIVISSCVSGIIGDDLRSIQDLSTPEVPVIAIEADGDIAGDYMHGIDMCREAIAKRLVDKKIEPDTRSINIIGEIGVASNAEENVRVLRQLLDPLGISINCRFLGDATCDQVTGLRHAPLSVMAADSPDVRALTQFLTDEFNLHFMDEPLPVGYEATERWLRAIGNEFICQQAVEQVLCSQKEAHNQWVARLRPLLAGKRVFLTTINVNIDWLLTTALEVGMEIVYLGVMNYLHQPVKITNHPDLFPVPDDNYDWSKLPDYIAQTKPDIVLSNYTSTGAEGNYLVDAVPMIPRIGFNSALHVFERWANLFETKREGAWKNDRALFEKYFS